MSNKPICWLIIFCACWANGHQPRFPCKPGLDVDTRHNGVGLRFPQQPWRFTTVTLGTLFWLFVSGFVIWYWWRAKAIQDSVRNAAKAYCKRMDVMLLDDAVYLRGLWIKRDRQGQLRVWRRFMFDFTSTGEERYMGRVIMLGQRIEHMELDPHRFNDFH